MLSEANVHTTWKLIAKFEDVATKELGQGNLQLHGEMRAKVRGIRRKNFSGRSVTLYRAGVFCLVHIIPAV